MSHQPTAIRIWRIMLASGIIAVLCLGAAMAYHADRHPEGINLANGIIRVENPGDSDRAGSSPPPLASSPLMQRIERILQEERATIATLRERLSGTSDESQALAVMREIEAAKRATEIQVMRAQAESARQDGRVDQAERIEAAIERLER